MTQVINTITFAQAQDNKKAVVATREGKEVYLAWVLKKANEPIYTELGGKRVEGVNHFRVDFKSAKDAKTFIGKAISHIDEEEYAQTRKTEPKAEKKVAPAPTKGKKADELVEVTLADGTKLQVKASALGITAEPKKTPRKVKGDAPTAAPNAEVNKKAEVKVEKVAPHKTKGNAELTDAQKKRLEICKNSILNRAASAYSIANGGEATTFKALGKSEKDLEAYIPNAKAAMLKSSKWAKAVEMGITEEMLG